MALERRRPLPAGRYWLDVMPATKEKWDMWRAAMANVESVKVETTEHFPAQTGIPGVPDTLERDFVIFTLTAPNVAWQVVGLPSPTIAPKSVTTSADTGDVPPPEPGPLEQLGQAAAGIGSSAKVGIGVGVAAVIVIGAIAIFRR